ncbi:tRNA-specific adenosine deaminase [Candidatus Photodesmus blepharus]|uniref:tRNA-specific adenosine deaminase n=1 Tax=Candidatus Photodesmus blepharonis TaxID=1179155 RepID=A0A084CPH4_9GAMM|nr:tRNA adenosine(34) deaminase TadA [Candidatus Photodesmus blepharus]KEY91703.1 tRNA-specific adenosine deaminase [Candidatus Photodesmus blepharus]
MSSFQFTKEDENFMRRAIELASYAEQEGEVPVGAILIQNKETIAEGWNCSIRNHDPTAHAEIETLRKAGRSLKNYRLPNATLYVTLEPCLMCTGAILHSRVKRVVYATSGLKFRPDGIVLSLFANNIHHLRVENGLLKDECQNQLQTFFKERRKKDKV